MKVRLGEFAYARSGDKGANANVGVACREQVHYDWLVRELTEEKVAAYFADLPLTAVDRFEMPNLWGLNFIIRNALDGGAARSLRLDPQGKTLGESIMQMEIDWDPS